MGVRHPRKMETGGPEMKITIKGKRRVSTPDPALAVRIKERDEAYERWRTLCEKVRHLRSHPWTRVEELVTHTVEADGITDPKVTAHFYRAGRETKVVERWADIRDTLTGKRISKEIQKASRK